MLEEMILAFKAHFNSLDERVQVTHEAMVDNKLAHMDVHIMKEEDGSLRMSIYRKHTHTDQYLMFDSNHHINHKLSVISTLKHRISTLVTHEEDRKYEEARLAATMKTCKYPQWTLEERKKKQKEPIVADNEEEDGGYVKLPYFRSVSEKIAQVFKKYNISTIHIPRKKI